MSWIILHNAMTQVISDLKARRRTCQDEDHEVEVLKIHCEVTKNDEDDCIVCRQCDLHYHVVKGSRRLKK